MRFIEAFSVLALGLAAGTQASSYSEKDGVHFRPDTTDTTLDTRAYSEKDGVHYRPDKRSALGATPYSDLDGFHYRIEGDSLSKRDFSDLDGFHYRADGDSLAKRQFSDLDGFHYRTDGESLSKRQFSDLDGFHYRLEGEDERPVPILSREADNSVFSDLDGFHFRIGIPKILPKRSFSDIDGFHYREDDESLSKREFSDLDGFHYRTEESVSYEPTEEQLSNTFSKRAYSDKDGFHFRPVDTLSKRAFSEADGFHYRVDDDETLSKREFSNLDGFHFRSDGLSPPVAKRNEITPGTTLSIKKRSEIDVGMNEVDAANVNTDDFVVITGVNGCTGVFIWTSEELVGMHSECGTNNVNGQIISLFEQNAAAAEAEITGDVEEITIIAPDVNDYNLMLQALHGAGIQGAANMHIYQEIDAPTNQYKEFTAHPNWRGSVVESTETGPETDSDDE